MVRRGLARDCIEKLGQQRGQAACIRIKSASCAKRLNKVTVPITLTMSCMTMPENIRLLEKSEVIAILGICDRTLEKLVRSNQFPEPLRLGKRVKWVDSVVQSWLARAVAKQLSWEPPKRQRRAS